MMKRLSAAILGAAFVAQVSNASDDLADRYFTGENPVLTVQERQALSIAQQWSADAPGGVLPFAGRNGAVQFVYGAQMPSVVCAVLQVCDVALQPGERVNSIQLGDTARWNVEPAISGSGAGEIQHLLIKPLDVGLETSLVVTTDRRTYHIRLRSHRTDYIPQVTFVYPEEMLAKWDILNRRQQGQTETNTIPTTGERIEDLSFDYDVKGSAPWKPVRVYNNGVKTIIEMGQAMQHSEAPVLLVVRKDGSVFAGAETTMVNYRVQGNRYIVDAVFDKAILIAGVGRRQNKITITRRK